MKFEELLDIVGGEPVFETGLLLAGAVDAADLRRQLSRWTRSGRILQLRRGLYALAPPFRRVQPHPFLVANRMVRASYVSTYSALAHEGLLPEHVPVTTSVASSRTSSWENPLGVFEFRHLKTELLHGYRRIELGAGQQAFVATPEKALLDLIHLQPRSDDPAYLESLRLQNLEQLDLGALALEAERSGSPKLQRAAEQVKTLAQREEQEFDTP